MDRTTHHKLCPQCKTPAPLDASQCSHCGRVYRTKFDQSAPPVVVYPPAPQQAPPSAYTHPRQPEYPAPQQPTYPPQPTYYQPPAPEYYAPPEPLPADTIQVPPGSHSVLVAVLLAALLCAGLGQIYNKQHAKGAVALIVWASAGLAAFTYMPLTFISWGVYLAALIDAGIIANRLNRGEPVGPWQCF